MKRVFADTSYFLALLNTKDAHHPKAMRWSTNPQLHLIVTEFVLLELGNALSGSKARSRFIGLAYYLRNEDAVELIPLSSNLLLRGESLFTSRPDKEWSVTDCISFIVMTDEKISEVLTADHHFTQAGFHVLL